MIFSAIKRLPFWRNYTTKQHAKWWLNRKIDWKKEYLDTTNHPHRFFILDILKNLRFISIMELGCGSGPNLVNIIRYFKGKQIGGVDINPEAIALANKTFNGGVFQVSPLDNIMMSDKSTDISLTDMTLIYIGGRRIKAHLKEIKRITRDYVVLCEFHSESWWDRSVLWLKTGYFAHNYKKLLNKLDFYDIKYIKMPKEAWPDDPLQDKFRFVIVAKLPPRDV